MDSELMMGYVLYVDGEATGAGKSLEEAKHLGERYMDGNKALRIQSAVGPAPSQVWNYNYKMKAWVEHK